MMMLADRPVSLAPLEAIWFDFARLAIALAEIQRLMPTLAAAEAAPPDWLRAYS